MAQELPDFDVLSTSMTNAATEVHKMQNMAVVNITQQLDRIQEQIRQMERNIEQTLQRELSRFEKNSIARIYNSRNTPPRGTLQHTGWRDWGFSGDQWGHYQIECCGCECPITTTWVGGEWRTGGEKEEITPPHRRKKGIALLSYGLMELNGRV